MLRRPDEPLKARGRGPKDGRTAWLMRAYEQRLIRDITPADIDALEATLRKAKLSAQTRLKYTVVASMIFAFAESQGWSGENPVKAKGRQKREGRKTEKLPEVYSLDVVEKIAGKVEDSTLADAIRLAAVTGLRQGELLALRWRDVDFIGRKITVRTRYVAGEEEEGLTPKGGKVRTVPMSDQAGAVLDRLSQRDSHTRKADLVITDGGEHVDPSTLRRAYMRARDLVIAEPQKEGEILPSISFHSLRHTFGTTCAMQGVPMFKLQHWMGHANLATTQRYSHWSPQTDDAALLTSAFAKGTAADAELEAVAAA
jgi:integrase